jgi:hypothetical protein
MAHRRVLPLRNGLNCVRDANSVEPSDEVREVPFFLSKNGCMCIGGVASATRQRTTPNVSLLGLLLER